jgi:hypothetical protein
MDERDARRKRRGKLGRGALVSAFVGFGLGCQVALTTPPEAALEKFLRPVTTAPESVKLEVWEARVPLDQDRTVEGLWQQVDEQCLDANLRSRLLANGLRAGVLGGALPDELSDLLGLEGEMPEESDHRTITPAMAAPRVTRRVVQVNRTEHRTIQASAVRDEAVVLLSKDGRVGGKPFREVEGRYELHAEAVAGQRVSVRLVPELHHGELRNRYSGSDSGILLMSPSREREAFEELTIGAELGAGDALVMSCLPDSDSTLGGLLHTSTANGLKERRFIIVRLLESPPSEILAEK